MSSKNISRRTIEGKTKAQKAASLYARIHFLSEDLKLLSAKLQKLVCEHQEESDFRDDHREACYNAGPDVQSYDWETYQILSKMKEAIDATESKISDLTSQRDALIKERNLLNVFVFNCV